MDYSPHLFTETLFFFVCEPGPKGNGRALPHFSKFRDLLQF